MRGRRIPFILRVPLIYALVGGLWILLSDRLVVFLFSGNPDYIAAAQTIKGWFFVAITALLLFLLLLHEARSTRKTEQQFTDLFLRAVEGVFRSTPEGQFSSANPALAQMFGYSSPEEMRTLVKDIKSQLYLNPEDRSKFAETLIHDGVIEKFEAQMVRKDGSVFWASINARVIRDDNGEVIHYEGLITDITKQKQAELALQQAEERYRVLVEKLPAVVFMDKYENPQSTQYISPRIHDLLGYTPEEWLASDNIWEDSLHPEDKERVLGEDIRTNQIGDPFRVEYRLRARDGHYVWIREEAYLVNGEDGTPRYWQGILLDITQQKQIQEALGRREAILEAVSFAAEQFMKAANWEDCVLSVLERLGRTAQASRVYVFKKHRSSEGALLISQLFEWVKAGIEPQIGNSYLQNMYFAEAGYQRWIRLFDEGLPVYGTVKYLPESEQVEFQKEGILSIICLPIPVENDWWGFIGFDDCESEREWITLEIETLRAAVSMLGAAIQRRLVEEAVFRGETSYQGLFNSVNDAIYIQDVEGRFLDVNEGAIHLHEFPKEFFIGNTLEAIGPAGRNQLDEVRRHFERALHGEVQRFEYFGLRSQGQIFPMEMQLYKGVYFGEEVVIAVGQDITERKRAEGALQRQLKELTVLHAVALAESTAENQDVLLQRVTDIIGDTLYTDNCGILLLNKEGTRLQPHLSYRGTTLDTLRKGVPVTTGVSGMVARTRTTIRLANVREHPDYYEVTADICSELCVPIASGEKVLGVLNVESKQPDAFTEADERLLITIAGGVATALERLRFFELEQMRRAEAEALREATAALTATVELPEVFETILQTLSKLVPCASTSIELIDGDQVEIVAQCGFPREYNIIGTRFPHEPNRWGTDLWEPIILADVQADERFRKLAGTEYIHGWMGVPLIAQDMLIGYLNLDSDTVGYFTEEHGALVQTFANQAAVAIENARTLYEERRRTKIIEALADIANEIATTGEVDSLLEQVARRSLDLLKASHVAIYLLQDDHVTIKPVTAQGTFSHEIRSHVIKLGDGITGNIIQTGRSEIINDTRNDPRRIRVPGTSDEDGLLETMMSSALILRGKPIGAINVWRLRSDGLFNESELNFLISIAHQTSISIEAGRLLQETIRRAQETEAIAEVGRDISATL
ncbi:MAG: GAF domain-containing protein, partial [Chloroflexota bacterium]